MFSNVFIFFGVYLRGWEFVVFGYGLRFDDLKFYLFIFKIRGGILLVLLEEGFVCMYGRV